MKGTQHVETTGEQANAGRRRALVLGIHHALVRSRLAAWCAAIGLGAAAGIAAAQGPIFTVNSSANHPDLHPGDGSCWTAAGNCTLRAAVEEANANDNGPATVDVIRFNYYAGTNINLAGTELSITDELEIRGPGPDQLTLDADADGDGVGDSRIFSATDATSLTTISGLTLINGWSTDDGGAIFSTKDLALENMVVRDSHAEMHGGAVYVYATFVGTVDPGSITLVESIIADNTAGSRGGGISVWGDATITDSTIVGNEAGATGGGILQKRGVMDISGSAIIDNRANNVDGGGIHSKGNLVSLTNSTLSGNFAKDRGGGVYTFGNLTVENSVVSNNEGGRGGGICTLYGLAKVIGSTVSGNVGAEEGGGIRVLQGNLRVESSRIFENTGGNLFGGISVGGGGILVLGESGLGITYIRDSTVRDNRALYQGGGMTVKGVLGLVNSTVSRNVAFVGAGIQLGADTAATLWHSTVTENEVGLHGGGISSYDPESAIDLYNTIVAGNYFLDDEISTSAPDLYQGQVGLHYSLVGVVDDGPSAVTIEPHSLVGTLANPLDARLTPLADKGGPTWTHGLAAGSPALDNGNTEFPGADDPDPAYDQRGPGYPRVRNGQLDMGAFEGIDEVIFANGFELP